MPQFTRTSMLHLQRECAYRKERRKKEIAKKKSQRRKTYFPSIPLLITETGQIRRMPRPYVPPHPRLLLAVFVVPFRLALQKQKKKKKRGCARVRERGKERKTSPAGDGEDVSLQVVARNFTSSIFYSRHGHGRIWPFATCDQFVTCKEGIFPKEGKKKKKEGPPTRYIPCCLICNQETPQAVLDEIMLH